MDAMDIFYPQYSLDNQVKSDNFFNEHLAIIKRYFEEPNQVISKDTTIELIVKPLVSIL